MGGAIFHFSQKIGLKSTKNMRFWILHKPMGGGSSPPRPPPATLLGVTMVYMMTPMFSIFTLAIKFDCLFLTIYQRFHLFVGFIFVKLAPPPRDICFKRCFKSLSSPLQSIKQSQSAKNLVFFPFCFLIDMSIRGGYSPHAPPGYATG